MRIDASQIGVSLGGKPVLRGIDMTLDRGELVGLVGPNGAGKTTLLRVLADLLAPSSGSVRYDGADAGAIGRKSLARRIAFLAQSGAPQGRMRACDVVALGRLPHRAPFAGLTANDHAAIDRALQAADVEDFRERTLDSLSGGERMRVLLARALAVEAGILLADEPLAGLDPKHQLACMDLLRETAAKGAGVAVVLHDLTLAGRFCDRLVLLDRGRVLAEGPPETVLTDAHLAEAFGISVARGHEGGQAFALPWRPLPRPEDHG